MTLIVKCAAISVAFAFGLSACTAGPKYAPPTPPAPQSGAFISKGPTITADDQPPALWWKLYQTPALDQLVQDALVHNKSLLAAAANLREARAALSLARSQRYPSTALSAGAQYGVSSYSAFAHQLEEAGAASPSALYSVGMDVSYEVDLFGRIHRAVQAAAADYDATRAAEDITRVTVAGETTRAYLNACAYAQEYAVAEKSLELVTQTYDVTVKEEQFGSVSAFDVARARQVVEQTRATLPGYDGQRRTALFELAVLTGRPPEAISSAADACKTPPKLTQLLPLGDVQSLFRRRPDVRQAERRLAAAVARIGVATADLYPTITLGGSAGTSASQLGGLSSVNNLTFGVGPLLSWSFPNTLAAQAQVREARAVASAAYANFEGVVLQALQDTEEAVTAYGAELNRNKSLVLAREQSLIAFNLAQIQFQNGSASYLDLLTAQSNLLDANATLAASEEAVASDQVTVFKAIGGGWEQAPDVVALPVKDRRTGKEIKIN